MTQRFPGPVSAGGQRGLRLAPPHGSFNSVPGHMSSRRSLSLHVWWPRGTRGYLHLNSLKSSRGFLKGMQEQPSWGQPPAGSAGELGAPGAAGHRPSGCARGTHLVFGLTGDIYLEK